MATVKDLLAAKGSRMLSVGPDATVLDAALLMNEHRIGSLLVIEAGVLRVEASNRPGALGEVCDRLARAKINIQYLYGSVGISTRACLYLRVSDLARAKKVLER